MTDWTDHHQSISEWISDHSHTELQTATTGVQETITCSSSGWWLLFSPSTSCEKTCSPTATDAQHSSDSEQQHSSSSTAAQQQQRENVSQHTALVPLKETELTSKAVYVLVCTREYFPSQLYMEITVLCGLHATAGYSACLTGPLGSDSNTNTPDPLTRCGATRVPCRGTWRL